MKDNKFLVMGKDEKMLSCCRRLNELGLSAECCEACNGDKKISDFENIVLPLPTVANGCISGTAVGFDDFCAVLDKSQTVFCGNVSCKRFPCKAFSYYTDEGFLIKNSRLTAQGVLRIVLENTEKDLHSMAAAVTGYGHCGREICRLLKKCGAEVTSFSRRSQTRVLAENDGVKADKIENINRRIKEFNLTVNTVPCNIINSGLGGMSRENLYIEIASKPYGFNIADTDKYNFRYILAESLPGRFTPVSAGINIADTVYSLTGE